MIWLIPILLFFTLSCGVKGAPAPRQNDAYIFNSKKLNKKSSEDTSEAEK
jgi:hypothetical protein